MSSSFSQALFLNSLSPEPQSQSTSTQIDDQKTGRRNNSASGLNSTSCSNFSKHLTSPSNNFQHIDNEMCTEILGCETGSHIDPILNNCLQSTQKRSRETREIYKNTKLTSNFPPPLTSISNGYGIIVQAHGGGRLEIAASSGRSHFESERKNGRLRLFLHMNYYYRRLEQEFAENIEENGGKIGCSFKCGDESGNNNLTSSPICVAFT